MFGTVKRSGCTISSCLELVSGRLAGHLASTEIVTEVFAGKRFSGIAGTISTATAPCSVKVTGFNITNAGLEHVQANEHPFVELLPPLPATADKRYGVNCTSPRFSTAVKRAPTEEPSRKTIGEMATPSSPDCSICTVSADSTCTSAVASSNTRIVPTSVTAAAIRAFPGVRAITRPSIVTAATLSSEEENVMLAASDCEACTAPPSNVSSNV
mmetsp:Transcript_51060/g.121299  ORF Transcript_51060/g.121299 Transcript_51060/m.121299 type:complete len:213 (+) Transcript_51060:2375-3013(+)